MNSIGVKTIVIEQRTYVLHKHASMVEYLRILETEGLVVQKPIWGYADLEDRRRRRRELAAKPQWQACLAKIRPMIMTMTNKIMYPISFSPTQ